MSKIIKGTFQVHLDRSIDSQSRSGDSNSKSPAPCPMGWDDLVSQLIPVKILDAATLFAPHEPMFPPVNATAVLDDLSKRNLLDKVVPSPLKLTREDLKRRRRTSALAGSPSGLMPLKIFDDTNRAALRSRVDRPHPASPSRPAPPEPHIVGPGSINSNKSGVSSTSPTKIDVAKLYSVLKDSQRSTLEKSYFRLFAAFGLALTKQEDSRSIMKKPHLRGSMFAQLNKETKKLVSRIPHLEFYGTKDEFKFSALQAVPEVLIRVSDEQTKAIFRDCLRSGAARRQSLNRSLNNSPRAPAPRMAVVHNPTAGETASVTLDLNNVSFQDDSILDF